MKKVVIIDTSILCVYLQVAGYQTCGSDDDRWDYKRVKGKIDEEIEKSSELVLPLATIIETGNHISHSSGDRYKLAKDLTDIIKACVDKTVPWSAFSDQAELWDDENLKELSDEWPKLAARRIGIGDATISKVAQHYSGNGQIEVEIFTGDQGLKEFTPTVKTPIGKRVPRRRK